jgi:hypothetical protein
MTSVKHWANYLILAMVLAVGSAVGSATPAHALPGEVLILDTTITSPPFSAVSLLSLEEDAVIAAGKIPVVVNAATWATMTTADFADYDAIVLGDATCTGVGAVAAAEANAATWAAAVDGNVVIIGTDPVYHSMYGFGGPQGGDALTTIAMAFAVDEPGKTGLYATLSCYYHGTAPGTPVPVLSGLGAFTVTGVECYNDSHIVVAHPALATLTDADLSDWSCSVHEAFDSFPADFLPLAIAEDPAVGPPFPGSLPFPDGSHGVPYILARGEGLEICGDGIDNDGDGEVDEGCPPPPVEICGDGIDNDGDGLVDENCVEICGDGIDNDGDGLVDEDCNVAPDCDGATADPSLIWPPNHKFVPVTITVSDADGDPVVVVVTSIHQDEPVKVEGSGNTSPDGKGVGTATAEVRAERTGDPKIPGDGRVYYIGFDASDGTDVCSGVVRVGVPHDQGAHDVPIGGGPLYDSTVP